MIKRLNLIPSKFGLGRMSGSEYQANLAGLNTFFGAVLGFVLTGTEHLNSWKFGVILAGLSGTVVSILFISSSRHRVFYAVYTLLLAVSFPELIDFALHGNNLVPNKIRPTLIVWTLMTIAVEFWGRERAESPQA